MVVDYRQFSAFCKGFCLSFYFWTILYFLGSWKNSVKTKYRFTSFNNYFSMYVMCLLLKFKKLFPLHMVKKSYPGRTSIFFTWWVMKCIIAFYTCNILFPSPMVLFTCSDFSASWIHFLCSVVATCQFFGFIPDAMVTFSGLLIFCFRYVFYLAVSKLGSWINSWYNLNLSLPPGIQGGGMGREGSCILLCVETGFLITISSKGILQYILLTWHFFLYQKWQLLCGHLFHSPVCCFGARTLLF